MFQFPGFAFMSYEFRHKYLHLISTNPRLAPRMSFRTIRVRNSELQRSKVGFPIRKSADQRLFAPPHGLSQRTTSFIASQRQGIHRIPLRHLIALIIDAHRSAAAAVLAQCMSSIERPFCFEHIREHGGQAVPTLVARRLQAVKPERRSDIFPLYDDRQQHIPLMRNANSVSRTTRAAALSAIRHLVEPDGIEPTTSCLQSTRSPN